MIKLPIGFFPVYDELVTFHRTSCIASLFATSNLSILQKLEGTEYSSSTLSNMQLPC